MYIYIILVLIIVGVLFFIGHSKSEDLANPEKGFNNCDKRISEIPKIKTRDMYSNIER